MFFVFEGLLWKFFGALEAWIRRVSLIYGLLRFLEAFEFDSSKLQDLGNSLDDSASNVLRFWGWSSWRLWVLIPIELLYFWVLLNLLWCCLCSRCSWSLLKCLRKASIYWSLRVGEQHMAESDWWHMSQLNWLAYIIAYTGWIAHVIAYTCWTAYVIAYTLWCVIGFRMHFMPLFQWYLANFYWFLSSDSKT